MKIITYNNTIDLSLLFKVLHFKSSSFLFMICKKKRGVLIVEKGLNFLKNKFQKQNKINDYIRSTKYASRFN